MVRNALLVGKNQWNEVADVETVLELDLPTIECLPVEISQAVFQLVANASQAIAASNPEGRGSIRVTTRRAGDSAEIEVRDTGTGIPEDIRTRVFDPFFSTKDVGRGTGLGLAIVYDTVVNKHGGEVSCESELGVGSVFCIRLPVLVTHSV